MDARHSHLTGECKGAVVFDDRGVSFAGAKHKFAWPYGEIQQLEIGPKRMRVVTYEDSKWKFGADRSVRFNGDFSRAYAFLKTRMDERLIAAVADEDVQPVWEAPAKLLHRFGGSQGKLVFGSDRVVFQTAKAGDARTWRYGDIENISRSGPFEFTVKTYDSAYRFQLKQALSEEMYDSLWKKLYINHRGHREHGEE